MKPGATRMGRRIASLTVLTLVLAGAAPGYYHFVRYRNFSSPYAPMYEKFDLASLPDGTLRLYVSAAGPELLGANDSFLSIVSQVKLAAKTWNDVPTSGLRVAFGGISEASLIHANPGVDVVFDEIPPGLIAMGGPTSRAEPVVRGEEVFIPITRAVVVLNKDLSRQPSGSDAFFMTLVHELGHALGLQHTFTSATMSTSITRATTKARPLAADDAAAISLLYPAPDFAASTGVIRGRVVLGDAGVHLASVVALSPQGRAVSALSLPDGTYEILGVPPGQYYVYAHPLPPPVYGEVSRANIRMPQDPSGTPLVPDVYFETQFYPGVKRIDAAAAVTVERGGAAGGIDFFVRSREAPSIHSVTTYSFPGDIAVPAGHLSIDASRRFLVAYGFGLSFGAGPAPGLEAAVIGGSASIPAGGLLPYAPDPRFVQINLEFNPFSGTGSRHLLFSLDDDIYVLPSGLQLSQTGPPAIQSVGSTVDESGAEAVVVVGERISERSTILFDGAPGRVLGAIGPGQLLVRPPRAPGGHLATVVALNPDGQTSWFLNGLAPPIYSFPAREPGGLSVSPPALPAGTEAMVEIRGVNTGFDADTLVGFGSSDAVVRDVLVLDPSLILANVAVSPGAPEKVISVAAVTGLDVVRQARIFQVAPSDLSLPSLHSPAWDGATRKAGAYIGKPAILRVTSLPPGIGPEQVQLTFNDVPAAVESIEGDFVRFVVPPGLGPGPVIARLDAGGRQASPLLLRFALAPPLVLSTHTESGAGITAENPARPGQLVQIRVADLGLAGEPVETGRVQIEVGGLPHSPAKILDAAGTPEIRIVQFFLGTSVLRGDQVPLRVLLDGHPSEPVDIAVRD